MMSMGRTRRMENEDGGRGANPKGKTIVRRKISEPENSSKITLKTDIILVY